jgi:hypothetical protein
MSFTQFCATVLGVTLTPAQRVLCAVAFDGVEPVSLKGADREIARKLFGDVDQIPPEARHVLVAVCGARGGKTYLCALRLLYLALTVPLDTLAPGELAVGVIVAPDLRLARQALRYALGAARACKAIAARIESDSADGFVLKRENGHRVSVECLPATRGGSALRGRSLVGAVLDECAFFRDESYQVNDTELFKAVAPRVMAGGQVVIASTPWSEAGLLFDSFHANHGHPRTAIAAHAPTLLLRNDARTRGLVERERERDPDNARREFDAEFMSAGTGAFFDPAAIDAATDADSVLPRSKRDRALVSAGADFGFRSDSSALVVVQRAGGLFHVDHVLELRPEKGKPLVPSVVVATFANEVKGFGHDTVVSDAHYRESVVEHLESTGLLLQPAPEGQTGKAETYVRARTLINEGKVRLPNHPRLLRQLKEVVATPTSGGGLSISSPRWRAGGHGDLVSAFVLAVFDVARQYVEPEAEEKPKFGTPAYYAWLRSPERLREEEEAQLAREEEELRREQGLEWWDKPTADVDRWGERRWESQS